MRQENADNSRPRREPSLALPDAVGLTMGAEHRVRVIQQTMEVAAQEMGVSRLAALSYIPEESQLRGGAVFGIDADQMRNWRWSVGDFVGAERAIRTGQIVVQSDTADFPPEIAPHFSGEIVIVPLILAGRALAVIVGQLLPGTAARSPVWQAQAAETAVRTALMVEMLRLSVAYRDEQSLRHSSRVIAASILEGHPLEDVAALITDAVAERLRVERVGLFLRGADGKLHASSLRNVSADYAEGIARLSRPTPAFKRSVATGLPYYTRNVQEDPQVDPELRALFQREEITTLLLAVMQQGAVSTGTLVVYPCGERQFTPAEIALFQSFTDQAALAVAMTQQMEQQREMAMSEERNRLAREMHDTVAQSLTGLILQIETARTSVETGDLAAATELLGLARIQAKRALEDTRRAVQGLAPASLERLTAAKAIAEDARHFEAETGIPTLFIQTGEEQPLPPDQQTALLRIAQEALTNARRHAQAQRVRVGLQFGPESVSLIIEDDGIGFDVEAAITPGPQGGYGLFGMRERARLLDGELEIESPPGWGTRLRAVLPYRPASSLSSAGRTASAQAAPTAPVIRPATGATIGPAATQDAIRVLLADDHDITRQGVRAMLERSGEIVVVGEALDGAQAVAQARALRPDVVLMDIQMPLMGGLEATRVLHAEMPELPVVILTTFQTAESVAEALSAGAKGYLLKDADAQDLVAAVRAARRGEALLASAVADRLATLATSQSVSAPGPETLNEREQEILQLLARGARNKEIAAQLFLSIKTVEYHMAHLFHKLGVSNRTEAARVATERGLVAPEGRGLK
jgi:DNA-binding NarL/FixJ family response regulator/signal transduction histidine kinase